MVVANFHLLAVDAARHALTVCDDMILSEFVCSLFVVGLAYRRCSVHPNRVFAQCVDAVSLNTFAWAAVAARLFSTRVSAWNVLQHMQGRDLLLGAYHRCVTPSSADADRQADHGNERIVKWPRACNLDSDSL